MPLSFSFAVLHFGVSSYNTGFSDVCTKLAVSANWIRHHAARGAMQRGRVEGPQALTTPWLKSTGNIDRLNEISRNTYDDAWSDWYRRMGQKHEAVTESIEDAQTVLRAKANGQRAFAA